MGLCFESRMGVQVRFRSDVGGDVYDHEDSDVLRGRVHERLARHAID